MNRRVRVLHLIDSLELGGAQTTLLAWLQAHDRQQFEVSLAAMHGSKQSLFHARARALEIPIHYLSPRRWWPGYLIVLPWLLASQRYDVVHCHLFASNWIGKPLAKWCGVRLVISHDHCNDRLRAESRLVTGIDAWANRFTDHIYAVAESIRRFLIDSEKIPANRVEVIPNSLEATPASRLQAGAGKRIGGAGRLVPQKKFDRFLLVAKALRTLDPSYEFTIAGEGPLEKELQEKAIKLGVPVDWLGALPSLDNFFPTIDLFLLTSDFEGLPMTLLESLRAGIPAVACSVDGVNEFFGDEILKISPQAAVDEWAAQIHGLMQDSVRKDLMIKTGRELIEKKFLAKNQIARMEEKYVELLSR